MNSATILTYDECGCPVIDEQQLEELARTNPDELSRQMFQLLADDPDARAAFKDVMEKVSTGITWLTGITVLSLGAAVYCWATRK